MAGKQQKQTTQNSLVLLVTILSTRILLLKVKQSLLILSVNVQARKAIRKRKFTMYCLIVLKLVGTELSTGYSATTGKLVVILYRQRTQYASF